MVDPAKRKALLKLIRTQPEHEEGQALVTVDEFFDGNDDLGSIGCNLAEHPGMAHFQRVLKEIEALDGVDEVWMQISDLEESEWAFSENVLIFGNVQMRTIRGLTESLQPSEVSQLQLEWDPSRPKHLKSRKYVNLWWD